MTLRPMARPRPAAVGVPRGAGGHRAGPRVSSILVLPIPTLLKISVDDLYARIYPLIYPLICPLVYPRAILPSHAVSSHHRRHQVCVPGLGPRVVAHLRALVGREMADLEAACDPCSLYRRLSGR